MSLKVIDGLRTVDGANSGIDLPFQSLSNSATANGTSQDMTGFAEFLMVGVLGTKGALSSLVLSAQESNSPNTGFTNISSAATITANTVHLLAVDWKNPTRKRYARTHMQLSGANAIIVAAVGLRLGALDGELGVDGNVTEV